MKYERLYRDGATGLWRIRAIHDIPGRVEAGELGGLIEGAHNLSQEGACWVDRGATVRDRGWVTDDAWVRGQALVHERASVADSAVVEGVAIIEGGAVVAGDAVIGGMVTVRGFAAITSGVCEGRSVITSEMYRIRAILARESSAVA